MPASRDPDDDTKEQIDSPPYRSPAPATHGRPLGEPAQPRAAQHERSPSPGEGWDQPTQQPWPGQQPPWQPAEQGWRQPSHQWGAPPGYWTPVAQYPTNPLVVTGGVVLLVLGLLITLLGILGLLAGMLVIALIEDFLAADVAQLTDFGAFTTVLFIAFGTVVVVGVLHLLSSIGIFMHKGWARAIGLVLAVLGTLAGVVGVGGALEDGVAGVAAGQAALVPGAVAVAYAVTLFALIAGGNHFSRRYPR